MNILFISSAEYNSLDEKNIYTDLLRQFEKNGHYIWAISPRTDGKEPQIITMPTYTILRPLIMPIQKNGPIKKGLALLLVSREYIKIIKNNIKDKKIDLIIYATPPVNIVKVIKYCKNKYKSKTYLLLKDIWPDGIADLGVIKRNGVIYKYFQFLEKKLYQISDNIGCLSQANVDYLLKHNPFISKNRAEICPNCIEPKEIIVSKEKKIEVRKKYGIPENVTVFVYGGNLGKPQGVSFIIKCLKSQINRQKAFYLIIGDGTERSKIETFINDNNPQNIKIINRLPKEEFDIVISTCDVGLVFLDSRFNIPNFPSRLLSYMQAKLPVLICTDCNTDVGKTVLEGEFGWFCISTDVNEFNRKIEGILMCDDLAQKGNKAKKYLIEQYHVKDAYSTIIKHMSC